MGNFQTGKNNTQHYFLTKHCSIEDIIKCESLTLENNFFKKNIKNDDDMKNCIHITTLDDHTNYKLDYNYAYEVDLPKDNPELKIIFLSEREKLVNMFMLGQKYNICNIDDIEKLKMPINVNLMLCIAYHDEVNTLEHLRINNKINQRYAHLIPLACNLVSTLDWWHKHFNNYVVDDNKLMAELVEALISQKDTNKIRWLIEKGHKISKIQHLEEIYKLYTQDCEDIKDYTHILDFLKENKFKFSFMYDLISTSIKNNQASVFNWVILNHTLFSDEHDITAIVSEALLSIIYEIYNNFNSDKIMGTKCLYDGQKIPIDILKVLEKSNIKFDINTIKKLMVNFAICGTDEHYQWLVNNEYKKAFGNTEVSSAIYYASINENMSVLNWFKNNGCSFEGLTGNLISSCVKYKCVNSLEWTKNNFANEFKVNMETYGAHLSFYQDLLLLIINHDDVDTYNWIKKNAPKIKMYNKKMILTKAYQEGSINILNDIFVSTNSILDDIEVYLSCLCGKNYNRSLEWLKSKDFKFTPEFINNVIKNQNGFFLDFNIGAEKSKESLIFEWLKENVINVNDLSIILGGITDENTIQWFKNNYPKYAKLIDEIVENNNNNVTEKKRMIFE